MPARRLARTIDCGLDFPVQDSTLACSEYLAVELAVRGRRQAARRKICLTLLKNKSHQNNATKNTMYKIKIKIKAA